MEKGKLEEARIVDVHAHLDEIEDLSRSLQEAKAAIVIVVVAVGMDIESNKKILKIAEENNGYVSPTPRK